jgi:protein-tyrosine phosphatase
MFNFFSKSNKVTDISWLGVDMHSHILPGIDDGSPNIETALRYVKALQDLGYRKLIGTPHIYKDLYPNTPTSIDTAKAALQKAIDQEKVNIVLDSAAEYMLDQDFDSNGIICTLPKKHILIEMSYLAESPNIKETIFDLRIKGYVPVLAHPERYIYYFKDKSRLKRFKEKGCLMQLNILSILGYYGKDVKNLAQSLLKNELYDFAGTDLHHDNHLNALTHGIQSGKLFDLIGNVPFKNIELFEH